MFLLQLMHGLAKFKFHNMVHFLTSIGGVLKFLVFHQYKVVVELMGGLMRMRTWKKMVM